MNEDALRRQHLSSLLANVAQHDRQAFEALYRLTSSKLFGICARMLRQRSDAEDALQEIYVTVWRKAELFDAKIASPITWLAMIARNKCIERLRTGGVERNQAPVELADSLPAHEPVDPHEVSSDLRRLDQCLGRLEDNTQGLIRTAFLDGCTYDELANRKGVPLGTMKSWIRRGLLRLKACLEQ